MECFLSWLINTNVLVKKEAVESMGKKLNLTQILNITHIMLSSICKAILMVIKSF